MTTMLLVKLGFLIFSLSCFIAFLTVMMLEISSKIANAKHDNKQKQKTLCSIGFNCLFLGIFAALVLVGRL